MTHVEDVTSALRKHHFTTINWRKLCLRLGISYDTLSIIEDEQKHIERRLEEGIAKWLGKKYDTTKYPLPSWKVLVEALKGADENSVADGIKRDKCTDT